MSRRQLAELLYANVFRTRWGWVATVAGLKGLCGLELPGRSRADALERIKARFPAARAGKLALLSELEEMLRQYFAGVPTAFPVPLDLGMLSSFGQRVLRAAATIPYGQVRTYGWVARYIGNPRGTRAVGGALKGNPIPVVVPCHRVIASDGSLGGFSAAGGVAVKRKLLELEGVRLS